MLLEKLQVRMNEAEAKANKLKVSLENLCGIVLVFTFHILFLLEINVNKLTSAGCRVKIWIVAWFAQLTNLLGGQFKKINVVGRYLIQIWKAVGMDSDGGKVEFLRSSNEINRMKLMSSSLL